MKPCGTGSTIENCAALDTEIPLSVAGTVVATGAVDRVTVEPRTAVGGRLIAVWTSWMTPARTTYGLKVEGDYRKILDRKDIDGVIIGTPDHWHAIPFIAACEAGKDIYCEKPISHSVVEAKAMVGAAKHFNRVVQVGTWQRSVPHFLHGSPARS